jgi:hypothetical protein
VWLRREKKKREREGEDERSARDERKKIKREERKWQV